METLTGCIEFASAVFALPGEAESGDRYVVRPTPNGVLVAVVDGLGHGRDAAAAAGLATVTLEQYVHESVISLVKRCHESLRETRGVVLNLASFDAREGTMTWLGVGNVEGVLLRSDGAAAPSKETLLQRRGVVGAQLPLPHASILSVNPGDTLVFVTDGIRSDFADGLLRKSPLQQIADRIVAQYAKRNDEALVLVARYVGNRTP